MKRKRRRPSDPEKWNLTEWCHGCDKLFHQVVKLQAVVDAAHQPRLFCAVCATLPVASRFNAGQWHCHHLISRARKFFRHNLMNGICLDSRHHEFDPYLSAHAAPYAFEEWMEQERPEQYAWWIAHRNEVHKNPTIEDYRRIHAELEAKLAELGGVDEN